MIVNVLIVLVDAQLLVILVMVAKELVQKVVYRSVIIVRIIQDLNVGRTVLINAKEAVRLHVNLIVMIIAKVVVQQAVIIVKIAKVHVRQTVKEVVIVLVQVDVPLAVMEDVKVIAIFVQVDAQIVAIMLVKVHVQVVALLGVMEIVKQFVQHAQDVLVAKLV